LPSLTDNSQLVAGRVDQARTKWNGIAIRLNEL
jgi:hypothetical protein